MERHELSILSQTSHHNLKKNEVFVSVLTKQKNHEVRTYCLKSRDKMLNYTTTYYWSTGDTNCAGVFAFDAVTQKYDLQLIVGWSNG